MNAKGLVGLVALIMLLAFPCQGEYHTFPIWHYNAYLDFGGKNVTAETRAPTSDLYSIRHSIFFRGNESGDWGAIYLFDSRRQSVMVPEDMLRQLMMPTCKQIQVKQGIIGGLSGLIATGDARVEHGFGQRCYGGIEQLEPLGSGELTIFAVIGHFTNESLNEQFVKTARIEYPA